MAGAAPQSHQRPGHTRQDLVMVAELVLCSSIRCWLHAQQMQNKRSRTSAPSATLSLPSAACTICCSSDTCWGAAGAVHPMRLFMSSKMAAGLVFSRAALPDSAACPGSEVEASCDDACLLGTGGLGSACNLSMHNSSFERIEGTRVGWAQYALKQ